ncbi:unnamed protein product [Moneuplotes crassus]|uniref:TNFR-Cys domain-containing protein n=1 Tax=Euplotes crassus TaxID=5936 RepID=A0AAD1UDP8_EUPCR|nr:unnamed protein product [Moneuplotes crassus]
MAENRVNPHEKHDLQMESETLEKNLCFIIATGLCNHCPDGEYLDSTSQICRVCPNTCNRSCAYQSSCLTCPAGQSLDLKTLQCVTNCDSSSQIELTGSQISFSSVCRDFEYYVDPTSTEVIELGTKQYPYRSLKSVTSEILNHLSHHQKEIIIYSKDAYLQDRTMFFVNITNVKITTHPEYISWSRKAILTLTEYEQIGISKKARRHLLTNTGLPITDLINNGNFTTSEKTQANNLASNSLIRTGLEINNIDIYRERMVSNLFVQAIYLQNLDFKLSKFC